MRLNNPSIDQWNFYGWGQDGSYESKLGLLEFEPNDDNFCYKFFRDFTINSGHTVTTTIPCKGMYIYVYEDCIINGFLSMSSRGIYSPPTDYPDGYTPIGLDCVLMPNGTITDVSIPPTVSDANAAGINGACGGGGTATLLRTYGLGGKSGIFSGGAGGGGGTLGGGVNPAYSAQDYGGAGGNGINILDNNARRLCSGPGAGNPGGQVTCYGITYEAGTGTGGVIYLIVAGNLILNGSILSSGTSGHAPIIEYSNPNWSGAGGGSGGGSITIINPYKSTSVIPTSNIISSGGPGGAAYLGAASPGGAGSVRIFRTYT